MGAFACGRGAVQRAFVECVSKRAGAAARGRKTRDQETREQQQSRGGETEHKREELVRLHRQPFNRASRYSRYAPVSCSANAR